MSLDSGLLSTAQISLVNAPSNTFAQACPGAGKTHCLVQRFLHRPSITTRQGVALLSFTNAVAAEVRSRCSHNPQLLDNPNFIGTIDSFINTFIVGPVHGLLHGRWPDFKDTWSSSHRAEFFEPSANMSFYLDWFRFSPTGAASLHTVGIPRDQRDAISQLQQQVRAKVANHASRLYLELTSAGILDATTSRLQMWRYLEDNRYSKAILDILQSRFGEVIIDEIQDCSDDDLRLLTLLYSNGINIVSSGDLEQAIYSFRGSNLSEIKLFTSCFPNQLELFDNYRSTASICALNNSLRSSGSIDVSRRMDANNDIPIFVLSSTDHIVLRSRAIQIAKSFNLTREDLVVLAHRNQVASAVSGTDSLPSTYSDVRLALAQSAHSARIPGLSGKKAKRNFCTTLRKSVYPDFDSLRDDVFYQGVGLTRAEFEEGCDRLVFYIDPFSVSPGEYFGAIEEGIRILGWDDWIDLTKIAWGSTNRWPMITANDHDALRWSSIHAFKGLQSKGVLLLFDERHVKYGSFMDDWLESVSSERRRIYYVGASRAMDLLMLGVDPRELDLLVSILDRDSVPYVLG